MPQRRAGREEARVQRHPLLKSPIVIGKIALAHMKEFPDYYDRLERMEREAERESSAGT